MNWRDRTKLRGLLLGRRIAQETAAANLRAGQVLQEVGLAERGVKLDVEMKAFVRPAIAGCLVQGHHVGERYLPQIVEADQHFLEHGRQIAQLRRREAGQARMGLPGCDEGLEA